MVKATYAYEYIPLAPPSFPSSHSQEDFVSKPLKLMLCPS